MTRIAVEMLGRDFGRHSSMVHDLAGLKVGLLFFYIRRRLFLDGLSYGPVRIGGHR